MARKKAEIDLLGVATKEELVKFEVGKQNDMELAATVAKLNKSVNSNVVTEEELLKIKKRGEQEILDIQNELREFKLSEERKMSYLPIEEEEEEEEEYIQTRYERVKEVLTSPFIKMVDAYDELSYQRKLKMYKSVLVVFLLAITLTISVSAAKKYRIMSASEIRLDLTQNGTSLIATPLTDIMIQGKKFTITKISIDGKNTLFTFDGMYKFTDDFSAVVVDSNNIQYQMDRHYIRNLRSENAGRVLAMDPLNDGIREFDLIIKENTTGETFTYKFILGQFLKKPNYINMYNANNIYRSGLNIDGYSSTSSSSVINFSLTSTGLDYVYKIIDRPGMNMALYDGLNIIPTLQSSAEQYDFEKSKITLFQQAYNAPKNLSSTLYFKIDNIFKSYDANNIITNEQARNGYKLDYGQYSIYIESIQKRGEMAVLVYHCIDNAFGPSPEALEESNRAKSNAELTLDYNKTFDVIKAPASNTERTYAYLELEILLKNSSGQVVGEISPSKLNISEEGADVVFVDDRLLRVVNNFDIRINKVNIRDSRYEGIINLADNARLDSRGQSEFKIYVQNIEDAFMDRLGYKGSEVPRSSIRYFSNNILADKSLMERYTPLKLDKPATYSATLITLKEREGLIYAVVEEDFIYAKDSEVVHENVDHAIIYNTATGEIVSDVITNVNSIE